MVQCCGGIGKAVYAVAQRFQAPSIDIDEGGLIVDQQNTHKIGSGGRFICLIWRALFGIARRDVHRKARSLPIGAGYHDAAAQFADDPVDDGEAQA